MAYELRIHLRAQAEVEMAIEWYAEKSGKAPVLFIETLQNTYDSLKVNPFFQVRYKEVRSVKLRRFPFSLSFTIDDTKKIVHVLSCFHNHRNPGFLPYRASDKTEISVQPGHRLSDLLKVLRLGMLRRSRAGKFSYIWIQKPPAYVHLMQRLF